MNDVLQLVLVGCGAVSELYHAPALAEAQAKGVVRVAGLVDPRPDRLGALGACFPGAAQFTNLIDLPSGMEAAIVASPVQFHAAQAADLLDRGCAVLCEKPLCRNTDEAATLEATVKRSGRPLLTGLFRRFFPAAEQLRALAQHGGALGLPLRYSAEEGGVFRWPAASNAFFSRETAGGGVTMDIGSHLLDLLTWWFGDVVDMEYQDDGYRGVEANSKGSLRHASGVVGNFCLSWDLPTRNEYVVEFEHGTVRWSPSRADRVTVQLSHAPYVMDVALMEAQADRPLGFGVPSRGYLSSFTAQVLDLASAARGGSAPRVPLAAGLANLQLIERLYATREPWIPGWFTAEEAAAVSGKMRAST